MVTTKKEITVIPFRLHPRVFAALGLDLVTDDVVAVIELVKNSYDALATRVDVRFVGNDDAQPSAIEVQDNGTGMTMAELSDVWSVVATPNKLLHPITKRGHRRVSGEKGLGRFSTARLGKKLQIITKAHKSPCLQVNVDWNLLSSSDDIADCKFEVRKVDNCPFNGTGTLVQISQLANEWGPGQFDDLSDHLSRLVTPFEAVSDFAIWFAAPGTAAKSTQVEPPSFLGSPPYLLKGKVSNTGNLQADYSFAGGKRKESIARSIQPPERTDHKTLCGPFKFEIRAWDVDNENLGQLSTALKVGKETIRRAIRNYKGLSVYRDRILVLPKSEAARDWLGLDLRRVSKLGTRLSTSQIVGYVAISSQHNPQLSDTSDRERLVDNPASTEFKQLLKRVVGVLEAERDHDKDDTQHRERPLKDLFGNLSADHLVGDIRQLVASNAPLADAVPLVEDFNTNLQNTVAEIERRFYYYSRVASLGLLAATIVHEVRNKSSVIGRLLSMLQDQYGAELADRPQLKRATELADQALKSLERLAETFAPLASRAARKRRTSNLREVIEETVAMREAEALSRNIKVELRAATDFTTNVDPGELSAVIMNFLDNALYWVSYSPEGKRHIVFDARPPNAGRIEVQVHDSGIGITKGDEERIFWPGVTKKPEGLGMGLTVASEIVSQHGGQTKLMVPGDLGGASFAFDLPVAN